MKYISLLTLTALLGLASCSHFSKSCCTEKCHKTEQTCKDHCKKEKKECKDKESCGKKDESKKECKDHCDKKAPAKKG